MVDAGSISAFSTREETSEPDRRTDKDVLCGRGVQLVVGEVNCRHGRDASARAKASGLRAGKAYAKIDEAAKILEEAAGQGDRHGESACEHRKVLYFGLVSRRPGKKLRLLPSTRFNSL